MARDIVIPGETLITVKLPFDITGITVGKTGELGLSAPDSVIIRPYWRHREVIVDGHGPDIHAECSWMLASADIQMTLIHYDTELLDACVGEAMGGNTFTFAGVRNEAGKFLTPAGTMMGNNISLGLSGNHYLGLSVVFNNTTYRPFHFPATYLTATPLEVPIGTHYQLVKLNWRAIPYGQMNLSGEVASSGIQLWSRTIPV